MKLICILPNQSFKKLKLDRAPTTIILGDSIVKNVYGNAITKSIKHQKHVVVGKAFLRQKNWGYETCKTHARKKPSQIIIHVGTSNSPGNKNLDEIANKIVEFTNSTKTSKNNVAVFTIVERKDQFHNMGKEVNENLNDKCEENNLQLLQHNNINPFHHTNAKGLHLNNYRDKRLTRNFPSFIENG